MQGINDVFRIAIRKFDPFESAMQKFWDNYCELTGCQLKAELVSMDLHELHESTLTNSGLRDGLWDIAHINTDWLYEGHSKNAFLDLKPDLDLNPPQGYPEGWSESLLGLQKFDEQIIGFPFHDGPECLIYRKDLFEDPIEKEKYFKQYGVQLSPPKTWDEFHQLATYFQRPEENLYGSVFACYPDGHNTVFDFCIQLWSRGGTLLDEAGKININSTAAKDGLEFYRTLLHDANAVHPGSGTYNSIQAGLAFERGEAAMMINWFGFASICEVNESSQVKGKVEIDLLPVTVGNRSASLNVYWLYTIGSGTKHRDVAYDFIKFVTNEKNDKLLTLEGGIGCRISTWKDKELNHVVPYYHKLEQLHQGAHAMPQKSNWAAIASIIDEMVLCALNTPLTTTEILQAAQDKIELIDL